MNSFTRETGEANTYVALSRLVQTEKDEKKVARGIAMALRLELITQEQVSTLVGLYELCNE